MPDVSDLNSVLEQYGPLGLIAVAIIVIVRAYLAGQASGILATFLNGLFKGQPTRAETYGLHALGTTSAIDPARKILQLIDAALVKVQTNAQPKPPEPTPETKKESN